MGEKYPDVLHHRRFSIDFQCFHQVLNPRLRVLMGQGAVTGLITYDMKLVADRALLN